VAGRLGVEDAAAGGIIVLESILDGAAVAWVVQLEHPTREGGACMAEDYPPLGRDRLAKCRFKRTGPGG